MVGCADCIALIHGQRLTFTRRDIAIAAQDSIHNALCDAVTACDKAVRDALWMSRRCDMAVRDVAHSTAQHNYYVANMIAGTAKMQLDRLKSL